MSQATDTKELSIWETLRTLFSASRGFWAVNWVNFADGICYFGILTLLTRFLGTRLGMSDQLTGISVSTFTGLVTLFMIGGGAISDRLGVRRALSLSLLVMLIGRVLLTAAPAMSGAAHVTAWAGLLLMAAGTGVIQPALYAGIKEYTDPRTASIGYGILYAIMNLGIVAENFVSPFVREIWGIDGVYWMVVALTGFVLLTHMMLFTHKVELTERTVVESKPAVAGPKLTFLQKLRALPILDSRFMFFICILFPVRTLFAHQWLTMPDYVFRAYPEWVSAKFEWLSGLNPLIIVIFVPTIAALTRKAKVIDMMIIGTAITAATTFLLVPGPNLTALILYTILFSFGEAIWSSRFLEYVADLAPAGKVGAYMGIAGLPWFFAKFATGLFSGPLLAKYVPAQGTQDSGTLWLIYAFIACISPVGLILARKWILSKGNEAKAPAGATAEPA